MKRIEIDERTQTNAHKMCKTDVLCLFLFFFFDIHINMKKKKTRNKYETFLEDENEEELDSTEFNYMHRRRCFNLAQLL